MLSFLFYQRNQNQNSTIYSPLSSAPWVKFPGQNINSKANGVHKRKSFKFAGNLRRRITRKSDVIILNLSKISK